MEKPEITIYVILTCNHKMVDENSVELLDIEEDIHQRDIVTFVCPICGEDHKSFRIG